MRHSRLFSIEEVPLNSWQLLAWCSQLDNTVDIVDSTTKHQCASFRGVQLKNESLSDTNFETQFQTNNC